MADLIIEFTRAATSSPVEVGSAVNTQVIAIGTHTVSDPGGSGSHNIIDLYAGAACWVSIGDDPTATVGGGDSRFLASGERRQFRADPNHRVAVIAA